MNSRRGILIWVTITAVGAGSCSSSPSGSDAAEELATAGFDTSMRLTSADFDDGEAIPARFTCDGDDVSPQLSWEGVPKQAVELALVVDDPDASGGTYVHWVLFGLDPSLSGLEEATTPSGARAADNSAGDAEYKGPCPPGDDDAHRYRFSLYALDAPLTADDGADTASALGLIREAADAKGTLTGTFDR